MESHKCFSKHQDYTLVELSPQETLVEFSDDSSADPNNWTLVSWLWKVLGNRNEPLTLIETEQETIQCSGGTCCRVQ